MKCLLLKNDTECGADLSLTQEFCGNCGGDVEIDESKTKKCTHCSKRLILTDHFCTGCGFSFEDVTKKIICEGKKEDGTKCNHELSPSDRFCSTCDMRQRKEDVLDRGNDQNQTEEINKDQTEEINKDQTEEKNKDQTEEINKDQNEEKNKGQTEEKNKDQTDEIDGRDDESRLEQETEKQKPIFYEPSAEDGEPEKRGLAVVCSHSKFRHASNTPSPRTSASDDHDMMKYVWDLYGCHVIDFLDENGDFYENKLIEKIENELKKIKNIKIFVFVLSSHGAEYVEDIRHLDEQKAFQHVFFATDRQCSTQDLMNKIAKIEKLEKKLKLFVIQACRSRTVVKDKNEDHGVEIEIELEKGRDLSGGHNDSTVHPDAKGYMPHEDEKKNKPDDKRQDDGIDQSDAGGFMPFEDKEVMQQPNEFIIDLPPIEGVPHCDDCVVMFASMSGKDAYSKSYHTRDSGGWLIKSVDVILKKYEKGQQAHILDILVEINRDVGTMKAEKKQDTSEIPNLDLEIKMENLQLGLKTHVKKLREIYSNHSSKVEFSFCQDELIKLVAEIDQDGHTEISLNKIKEETVLLTKTFKEELRYVMLKSQSCFFHNLAFDDEDLFLCRIK